MFSEMGVMSSMVLESRVLSSKNATTIWIMARITTLRSMVHASMPIEVASAVLPLEFGIAFVATHYLRYAW
jgi:hypothetical protein